MFYLSGRGISGNVKNGTEDEFGWYLGSHEKIEDRIYNDSRAIVRSPEPNSVTVVVSPAKTGLSLNSTNFSTDSDYPDSYGLTKSFMRPTTVHDDSTSLEHIELRSFKRGDDSGLDINIDKDDDGGYVSMTKSASDCKGFLEIDNESKNAGARMICYTPERLVRCQEYRILTHSPTFFAIPRSTPNDIDDTGLRKYRGYRRRHSDIIDASDEYLPVTNRRRLKLCDRISSKKNCEQDVNVDAQEVHNTSDRRSLIDCRSSGLASIGTSYEQLDNGFSDGPRIVRPSSSNTSGIHSSDWSTDTPSDIPTPICLCEELATATKNSVNVAESKNRTAAINEVVSILEDLERDPVRATVLLEEDRLGEKNSGHDQLTRLALTIEQDGAITPVLDGTENLTQLRDKVERLQKTSRCIFKDIGRLRADFKYNESKVDNLTNRTAALRQNINEIRYLDDLLNLLDCELERISQRNWPFVFGHSEDRTEDMNLVV